MKFIDLFAGLGGFHLALADLGHRCVFASEILPDLRDLYEANHGIRPAGDITAIPPAEIPDHDILCGGFPCQPFSTAGLRQGVRDPRGTLIHAVLDILQAKRPQFALLENVPGLQRIDNGETFRWIMQQIQSLGYKTNTTILSPHQYEIPQHRPRLFIAANLQARPVMPPANLPAMYTPIRRWLHHRRHGVRPIPDHHKAIMKLWQSIIKKTNIKANHLNTLHFDLPEAREIETYAAYYKSLQMIDWKSGMEFDQRICLFRHGGFRLYRPGLCPTLCSFGYIPYCAWNYTYLTENEMARLMGLEKLQHDFKGRPRRQLTAVGNSVCVPVVHDVAGLSLAG